MGATGHRKSTLKQPLVPGGCQVRLCRPGVFFHGAVCAEIVTDFLTFQRIAVKNLMTLHIPFFLLVKLCFPSFSPQISQAFSESVSRENSRRVAFPVRSVWLEQ